MSLSTENNIGALLEGLSTDELRRVFQEVKSRIELQKVDPESPEDAGWYQRLYAICMTEYGRIINRESQKKSETLNTPLSDGRTYSLFLADEMKEIHNSIGEFQAGPSLLERLFHKIMSGKENPAEAFENTTAKNYLLALRFRFESVKKARDFETDADLKSSLGYLNKMSTNINFVDFNFRENLLRIELLAAVKLASGHDVSFYRWARSRIERQSLIKINMMHETFLRTVQETLAEEKLLKEQLMSRQKQMDQELKLAQRIQQSLLPGSFPEDIGLNFFASYIPLESVGGDFYDVTHFNSTPDQPEGRNGSAVFIADVSGHGVPAAFIASMAKIGWQNALSIDPDPGSVLSRLNDLLYEKISGNFLTAFMGFFERKISDEKFNGNEMRGVFRFSSAGHHPAILLRPGCIPEQLQSQGQLIGIFQDIKIKTNSIPFYRGDRFVFFTDGFPEARSPDGNLLGMEGFLRILHESAGIEGNLFCTKIVEGLLHFLAGSNIEDDLTLVVVDAL